MFILLNVPNTIRKRALLGTSNFLLIKSPVWQLDLVGEQRTASHDVDKLELGFDGADLLFGQSAIGHRFDNLDSEEVVGVTFETFVSVGRDLVLPFCLADRRAYVV